MTANQIAYQRNVEDKRFHSATTALGRAELAEKNRSARAVEQINARAQAAEEQYKLASTEIQRQQLAEAARHNREAELQSRRQLVKQQDLAMSQFETQMGLSRRQQDLDKAIQSQRNEISALSQQEQARSNLAQEMLKRALQDETVRHNMRSEYLSERQQVMAKQIASADRSSRERLAAASNYTSTMNTVISGLFRTVSSGKGLSQLGKLIKGGN